MAARLNWTTRWWTGQWSRRRDYAGRAYSVLRYGLVYSLSHRGYPHLDAGDRIKLEIDGTTVPVLITENTITYKGGAMRGTAKARRLL